MIKILILAILITLAFIGYGKFRQLPPIERRNALWRGGSGALLIILVVLVVTGRMHWVGALLGALLPFTRNLLGLLAQLLPHWRRYKNAQSVQQENIVPSSIREAAEVLGLRGDIEKGDITADMVHDAHRHLIQKLHPDRGGNDYLAAKINQARDLLIKHLQRPEQD